MSKRALRDVLVQAGLSHNEAAIYLAALSLGPSTVSKIARAADVKRTTAYSIIESLCAKSLMQIEVHGLKQFYIPTSPEQLHYLLEQRNEILRQQLPALSAIYNFKGGESSIKLYKGVSQIKNIYESLLADIGPAEEYMIVSCMADWHALDPVYFEDFTHRRAELSRRLKFRIRLLAQDSATSRRHKRMEKALNETIKFLPKSTLITTNLVVIPRRVVIHQLKPPVQAMVIENPHIIRMHQEMFEVMWAGLE